MTTPDPNSPSEPNRPEDTRPKPQYGELAPEGWTWTPPQDQAAAPADQAGTPADRVAPLGPIQADAPAARTGRAPAWDRPVTLGVLIFGLLSTVYLVSALGALPEAMQVLYTQEGLGSYAPAASVAGMILAGRLVLAGIWLAAAALSILLMTRGRRAFYVPLIGGAVSLVAVFVFIGVILTTDPTLLELYGQP